MTSSIQSGASTTAMTRNDGELAITRKFQWQNEISSNNLYYHDPNKGMNHSTFFLLCHFILPWNFSGNLFPSFPNAFLVIVVVDSLDCLEDVIITILSLWLMIR